MLEKYIDNARENSLTAAVISQLLHLTNKQFWRILSRACYTKHLPDDPGEPLQVDPWPTWYTSGLDEARRVTPDLFMRFDAFDLIIEAKLKEVGTQYCSQWQRELVAYTNEYGKDKQQVRMIALGGIHHHADSMVKHTWISPRTRETHHFICPVHMCQWSTVQLECQRLKRDLSREKRKTSRTLADMRILDDLTCFFAVHNYPALRWFADLDFKLTLPSAEKHQQFFRDASSKFPRREQ